MSAAPGQPADARDLESATMVPVYEQLPFVPVRGEACEIVTADGRRILDLYGGHAVAALGYGHPALTEAIRAQAGQLIFQSNALALDVRAHAARRLVDVSPPTLARVFLVNSGAEANENALRLACMATGRGRILAVSHGFHGRTAAAAAVTWKSSASWYGFPRTPFDVDFIPRDDAAAAASMIDDSVAGVIFEPVQGIAGAYALAQEFVTTLRERCSRVGALLIADEVQCGMGRSGQFFAVETFGIEPDLLTTAKALGGGIPCGALLCTEALSGRLKYGSLGTTFGGGPVAAAAIVAVIDAIEQEGLLGNVRAREAEIRAHCIAGPVLAVRGRGLLLGLVCDRPAAGIRDELLDMDILTGTSSDPHVLRLLPPLVLEAGHVERLANALARLGR
ncbi:MAG: aminotransferase class III-fold pyridoxal phosphate-dependent enzyme [Gammaproteobacteria bacterium]|nr:aminotransferase class III-fold pyridoxal phosphate-dependent enzyme [Gammaproteobacteria bacterium]